MGESRMKLRDLMSRIFIFILCLSLGQAWFWSSDESSDTASEDPPDKAKEDSEVSDGVIQPEQGEANQLSKEQLNTINRDEFERRLAETIKAHESHHLNTDSHLEADDHDHDLEFDHQAFLGDEAEEFNNLTPEESKERLSKIVLKIDVDNDTLIDLEELTKWIKETQARSVLRRTEDFWLTSNPDMKAELSWDEYRAIQYGFLTDEHITDKDRRWIMEEDVDPDTLKQFKQLEDRDRRRWTVADRDKNLQLTKEEFKGFIHPEYYEHMYSVNRDETMADLDMDGDGKLSLSEFVKHLYGDTEGLEVADWDSAGLQFRQFRDHNKDGFIDKDELMVWIHPREYDQDRAEAEHLIKEADSNEDKALTVKEVLDNHHIFVSSQATDFGQDLHYHRDEL